MLSNFCVANTFFWGFVCFNSSFLWFQAYSHIIVLSKHKNYSKLHTNRFLHKIDFEHENNKSCICTGLVGTEAREIARDLKIGIVRLISDRQNKFSSK
jgi:hypothetical protein